MLLTGFMDVSVIMKAIYFLCKMPIVIEKQRRNHLSFYHSETTAGNILLCGFSDFFCHTQSYPYYKKKNGSCCNDAMFI